MTTLRMEKLREEKGFTLVELAIVMIIIGLLIGGILKGQELIANAQVTSTVAQVKGIDAAVSTFRDMYDSFPGDVVNVTARIPSCSAAPCSPGGSNLGNGRIDVLPDAAQTGEALAFFTQMSAADLLTGIEAGGGNVFGGTLAAAEIGGGYHSGYSTGAATDFQNAEDTTGIRSGHYLVLNGNAAAAIGATSPILTPNEAQRIDTKLDDGNGDTGSVRAFNNGTANSCSAAGVYQEVQQADLCGLYIRIQG